MGMVVKFLDDISRQFPVGGHYFNYGNKNIFDVLVIGEIGSRSATSLKWVTIFLHSQWTIVKF